MDLRGLLQKTAHSLRWADGSSFTYLPFVLGSSGVISVNMRAFRSHFGWWNSQDLLKHAGVAVEPESVSLESQAARDQRIMDLFAEGVPDSPGVSEDEDEFD